MKILCIAAVSLVLVGCSNQAAQDYYIAVQASSMAQAQVAQARYDALADMAATGSSESKTAAVMALAMYRPEVVEPRYVESDALRWASVLGGPVASVAGVYINSEQAVKLSKISNKTARAQIDSTANTQ